MSGDTTVVQENTSLVRMKGSGGEDLSWKEFSDDGEVKVIIIDQHACQ